VSLTLKPTQTVHALACCAFVLTFVPHSALAQERVFRCPGSPGTPVEYINNAEVAKSRNCKPMEGGNITVIQGPTPPRSGDTKTAAAPRSSSSTSPTTAARSSGERVDAQEQRARDSDARAILEAEQRKAEERLVLAQKAYANGAPEKEGIEPRNHQRYLDRVAELKAAVARAESDVLGIRRELGRLGGTANAAGTAAK